MLEIVETDHLVERFVFEWKVVRSELQDVVFEKVERGFAVDKIQVGTHPKTALFPQKIAEDALSASQIEDNVCGFNIEMFFEKLEFFPLFEGSFHQLQLPRFSTHDGRLYHNVD